MISIRSTPTALCCLASLFINQAHAKDKVAKAVAKPEVPLIQVAVLLDTSTSMQGLLKQAQTRLWQLVTEFATATRDGETPRLEVALYEYGSGGFRHLRQVKPLSDDLDLMSEELFELDLKYPPATANHPSPGGAEHCGEVMKRALDELAWSENPNDVRVIFIAGNEEFTQGPVEYLDACKLAIAKDVVVNTIFCGDWEEGVRVNWQDGAFKAEGAYFNINQNQVAVHINAPQDVEIGELNGQLNDTYIAFSAEGQALKERQIVQDENASADDAATLASRAYAKASSFYQNDSWDLVDACASKRIDLAKIDAKHLPEAMREMSPEERKAYVAKLAAERSELQKKILKLGEERKAFIAAERERVAAGSKEKSLDDAMITSLRDCAIAKGFAF